MIPVTTFEWKGMTLTVEVGWYVSGNSLAVRLMDYDNTVEGPYYAHLSVNVTRESPSLGEFVVHNDIAEGLLKHLLTMPDPIVYDTRRRVAYGYVHGAPVLRLSSRCLRAYNLAVHDDSKKLDEDSRAWEEAWGDGL